MGEKGLGSVQTPKANAQERRPAIPLGGGAVCPSGA